MKYLAGLETAPSGTSIQRASLKHTETRIQVGRKLLRMFLNDGKIRGINPWRRNFRAQHLIATDPKVYSKTQKYSAPGNPKTRITRAFSRFLKGKHI